MGHDYYDKDEVFNKYIRELGSDYIDEGVEVDLPPVDESVLGHDVRLTVEKVHESVQAS